MDISAPEDRRYFHHTSPDRPFAKESDVPSFRIRRINTFTYTLFRASFNGKV
jgi:hypothetical protein